jgi:Domain of unknown function (DUF1857)
MLFTYAHTVPINPPNATPRLTKSEVWATLLNKAREPQDYIPLITACHVVAESADGLTRDVTFRPGSFMPAGTVREEVSWLSDIRVRPPFPSPLPLPPPKKNPVFYPLKLMYIYRSTS